MPVTFLRTPADYLGIQEPPAQPLFQQTRALADPAVQNQLNYMDQVTQLRQQRPLARTQAIQNEYNTIFENANRLRMQQEAARQAEQAVSALAGLTPEADNYTEQRRQIQRQFPSAMLDTRVQSILDDNDRVFNARQTAAAKRSQDEMGLAADLAEAGMTDLAEAQRIARQGPLAVSAAKYQLGKGGSDKGNAASLKSAIDLLNDELKAMSEAGADYETVGDKEEMTPGYKALLERRNKYRDAYLGELDKTLFKQEGTAGAGTPPPPAVEQPTSFRDAMKKGQTDISSILKVDQSEVLKDLDDPTADENTFMMAIEDPNTSFEVKKRAAERLRQIADKPPKDPSLSLAEADARKSRLMQAASAAEKQVRMYPEVDKFRKAWTEEKGKIDKWINEYADSMGYDVDNLKVSLAKDEISVPDIENPITRLDEFKRFVKEKYGDVLSKRAEKLEPFLKSEFRKELGMGAVPLSTLGGLALALLAPGKGQGGKTYGDVLDAYLEEVKKPVAADATQANVTTTPKIEIGQPRKVQ